MGHRSLGVFGLLAACADVAGGGGGGDEQELITTVQLGFTTVGGAPPIDATWSDADLDGTPEVSPAVLAAGEGYQLTVAFFDEASNPVVDITAEVEAEGDEHQVFLTGTGVQSPSTGAVEGALLDIAYADTDAGALPLGLLHEVGSLAVGSGEIVVTLQHLPPQDGVAVKVAGLEGVVATDGLGTLPGETDVSVAIPFEVRR